MPDQDDCVQVRAEAWMTRCLSVVTCREGNRLCRQLQQTIARRHVLMEQAKAVSEDLVRTAETLERNYFEVGRRPRAPKG